MLVIKEEELPSNAKYIYIYIWKNKNEFSVLLDNSREYNVV